MVRQEVSDPESPLTWSEIENALKSMAKGKASGYDGLNDDITKTAGINGIQWLYRVLNVVWKEDKIPSDWPKGVIVPFYKKGSKKKCENY